jgi:hypothetical protein
MGILWAQRTEDQESLKSLLVAQSLYNEYMAHDVAPLSVASLMPEIGEEGICNKEVADEGWLDLERAYTHTLFFLAQAYGNCQQADKSAEHVVLTLKRQMASKQYDPLDWAINASGISQFFLGQAEWKACMHCLVCASHVAKGAATDDRPEDEEEKHSNIARCWLKYCIALLESGIEGLATEPPEKPLGFAVIFDTLDVAEAEKATPSTPPSNFADAKVIFQMGQKFVKESMVFYSLADQVSEYTAILQDHSRLYQRLAAYTQDPNDQCKLHKRRVDMLSGIEVELNQQYFLQVNRQLQFEIAETYQEMMNLKMARFTDTSPPDGAQRIKINKIGLSAIKWFEKFFDTLRDMKTKMIPLKLEGHVIRPFLLGKFNIASIWRKFQCDHPKMFIENNEKAVGLYKECLEGCKQNPDYRGFDIEKKISEEMILMIPIKVKRTLDSMGR